MLKLKKLVADNKGFIAFMLGMVLVRSALADYYLVPSSSMYPTLLEGDRVICDRTAYDLKLPFTDVILKPLADPQRGDIVTFSSPEDGTRLVKRLVAIPGDVVEMRDERLFINGQSASYEAQSATSPDHLTPKREYAGEQQVFREQLSSLNHSIIVMPERPAMRSFGPVTVPQGQYLMLGDNRDNSRDSRYIGLVKRELITGQVKRLMFSLNGDHYYLPRLERFGAAL
ncbi:signal peptidase I [Undibacterium crateris]|jgi:signal peptidase I|uniref:signal peptidase I n=1 Tax=Undibacterium crateris TaxID=2528175 RepID=UPI001389E5A4|nr:signal peptidase I [Undibacterium crateris]NDI86850.1 signal peptidase I [Undibacterium crateris]